jgi:hypothetical protein
MSISIDINIKSPLGMSKTQALPVSDINLYDKDAIEFAILDETINMAKVAATLKEFSTKAEHQSSEFIRNIITSGKKCDSKFNVSLPP